MKTRTMWLAVVAGTAVVGLAGFRLITLTRELGAARARAAETDRLQSEVDALRRERAVWKVQAEELRLRRRQAAEVHRLRGEATRRAQRDRAGEASQTPRQVAEITEDTDLMTGSQSDPSLSMDLDEGTGLTWGSQSLTDDPEGGMGLLSEAVPEEFAALTNWSSGVIRVWDVASGDALSEYFGGEGLTWAEFSADGARLITLDLEGESDDPEASTVPESMEEEDRSPDP